MAANNIEVNTGTAQPDATNVPLAKLRTGDGDILQPIVMIRVEPNLDIDDNPILDSDGKPTVKITNLYNNETYDPSVESQLMDIHTALNALDTLHTDLEKLTDSEYTAPDSKTYPFSYIAIPAYDPDTGDEIAPVRVGDTNVSGSEFPVFDDQVFGKLVNILSAVSDAGSATNRMPFGDGGQGNFLHGYLSLTDDDEHTLITYGNPSNLQELIISNTSDDPVCVQVRRVTADTEIYPFFVDAKKTEIFTFMGGIGRNATTVTDWTVQLLATPGAAVIVYGTSNVLSYS